MTDIANIDVLVSVVEPIASDGEDYGNTQEVEQHAKPRIAVAQAAIKVPTEEFVGTWRKAIDAVEAVFAADDEREKSPGLQLESITAKLSITANGKVAFIGQLGGEVAFEAVFRRA